MDIFWGVLGRKLPKNERRKREHANRNGEGGAEPQLKPIRLGKCIIKS